MSNLPSSIHVALAKAVERIVYVGDVPASRVHRAYINEEQLHELTVPYVAIVLGSRKLLRIQRDESIYQCEIAYQYVEKLTENTPESVDALLDKMEGNIERFQLPHLDGISAQRVEEAMVLTPPYNEMRLRELGVFDCTIKASWIIVTSRPGVV